MLAYGKPLRPRNCRRRSVAAEWLEPISTTSPCWAAISPMRRRMNARMKSSLSSASFWTTRRSPSFSIAMTSPSSRTRARTVAPEPRSALISPAKLPAVWIVTGVSPAIPGSTTSMAPDSTTRMRPCRSPGSVEHFPGTDAAPFPVRLEPVDLRRRELREHLFPPGVDQIRHRRQRPPRIALGRRDQAAQAERGVLDHAVEKEPRRAADVAPPPALEVLADPLDVDVLVHLRGEARHVELEPLGVGVQVLRLQVGLVVEQQAVHLPELALRGGALGRLGGGKRVGMQLLEREVAPGKPDPARKAREESLQPGRRLLADGAFEVAVFHDGHVGMRGALHVVFGPRRDCQIELVMLSHWSGVCATE